MVARLHEFDRQFAQQDALGSATLNAVKQLHSKGISTYGMRDGTIYETKPNGDRSPLADNLE